MSGSVARARRDHAFEVAAAVVDPELLVVTIAELGVLRAVRETDHGGIEVDITPTYSGCPAIETIRQDVTDALRGAGFEAVRVELVWTPPWTSDAITPTGREKLREAGIAPPPPAGAGHTGAVAVDLTWRCPRCGSDDTVLVSRFGSTPCAALATCRTCAEPFGAVKPL